MLESALLIRWSISVVVIILLLVGFFVILKILKKKGFGISPVQVSDKMKIVDKFYIDSKNKIIKIQDGDTILTVLVGSGSVISTEKIINKKLENKSDV